MYFYFFLFFFVQNRKTLGKPMNFYYSGTKHKHLKYMVEKIVPILDETKYFYMVYTEDFFPRFLPYIIKNQWSFYPRKYSTL